MAGLPLWGHIVEVGTAAWKRKGRVGAELFILLVSANHANMRKVKEGYWQG